MRQNDSPNNKLHNSDWPIANLTISFIAQFHIPFHSIPQSRPSPLQPFNGRFALPIKGGWDSRKAGDDHQGRGEDFSKMVGAAAIGFN